MKYVVALLLASAVSTQTGVLRISVVLIDANGNATPIPRATLLISDNPTSREPWRVRTGPDGTAEITLPAGNYTVESDLPVTLAARRFTWTQMLDVPAGRDTVLALTAANADVEAATGGSSIDPRATYADGAAILNTWQGSIAEIWTPTRHATGFVVDGRGLVATNNRAIGDATDVEVEFTSTSNPADRIKVPGTVIASDRLQGVTLVRVNPEVVASRRPLAACAAAPPAPVEHNDKVVALIAPMLEPRNAILGTASRPTSQSFRADWRLDAGSAGGPVFASDGTPIGIAVPVEEDERQRTRQEYSYVIPLANVCGMMAMAEKQMAAADPPPATPLRTETGLPPTRMATLGGAPPGGKAQTRLQPPLIPADEFDISLSTPAMIGADANLGSPRSFFGYWTTYVANAPQVLLVRVSPQFEESLWKTIARGAAATQGVALPPMPSFNSTFLRMRAFCGGAEVMPIQRLIVETEFQSRRLREGLYVFALTDFGDHCQAVRFDLFSEKSPNKADSRTIEAEVFTALRHP